MPVVERAAHRLRRWGAGWARECGILWGEYHQKCLGLGGLLTDN